MRAQAATRWRRTRRPQGDRRQRLDRKARAAVLDRPGIAEHVENAADHPDQPDPGRDAIADIDREQPQRRQEDRQPFQRVHLRAKHALEIRMARNGRQLDAEFAARPRHQNGRVEVDQDRQQGDERGEVIHR